MTHSRACGGGSDQLADAVEFNITVGASHLHFNDDEFSRFSDDEL